MALPFFSAENTCWPQDLGLQETSSSIQAHFFSIFESQVITILGPQSTGQIQKYSVSIIAQREVAMLLDERS